ncbi:MAG: hypothetical protein ACRDGG_03035 [Anaerolineae bacterium]
MHAKFSCQEFAAKLGANGDPKLNAAADFAARLLNGPVGDGVARRASPPTRSITSSSTRRPG